MRGRRGPREERERGQRMVNGRPRKTQEDLDKEMEDYWNKQGVTNGNVNGEAGALGNGETVLPSATEAEYQGDGDVEMME